MNRLFRKHRRPIVAGSIIALIAGATGFGFGNLTRPPQASGPKPASSERRPLYWFDPMNPAQHFDKPGKSPYMDMPLSPKFADEDSGGGGAKIDPARLQALGLRTATVQRAPFAAYADAPAVVEFNQRNLAVVQARAAGFVQRVYGRAPGDVLRRGDPIADLMIPSWNGAAAEYLALARQGDPALTAAGRQRLRLLGMPDASIEQLARTGKVSPTLTVTAPIGGAVQTLDVRQGMTVTNGQTLIQIAAISPVWLTLSLPQAQAAQVKPGQLAQVELAAFPGERFKGRVSAILPAAQADSRTVQARLELANPDGRLRPGMFATAHLQTASSEVLSVPTEAVIRTGKRAIVMVAGEGGRFQPVEVALGREIAGRIEVTAGLVEGQNVVTSGQFLLDSEASLAGVDVKPLPPSPSAAPKAARVEGHGRVEAIQDGDVTLSHDAIPALGWPAMTMSFPLSPASAGQGIRRGEHVRFELEQTPQGPVVRRLERVGDAR